MALTSQLTHYYNDKHGIEANYVKVFEMMSGLRAPENIGLTDKAVIFKMIKRVKFLFLILKFNNQYIIPCIAFVINFMIIVINCSLNDIILYGIPNSLSYALCCYYIFNISLWQMMYFYII